MNTFTIREQTKKRNLNTFVHYDFPFYLLLIYLFLNMEDPKAFSLLMDNYQSILCLCWSKTRR